MKIAIWHHTILSGGTIKIETSSACGILDEQMRALDESGLLEEADEFHIGLNGDADDLAMARMFTPCPHAKFYAHGKSATTEIPTLKMLQEWLQAHPDWLVLYHHMKGVTQPHNPLYTAWRRCMEKHLVWGWRNCLRDIENGWESCGAHWLTPQQFTGMVSSPFWGGNFWWATAKFLLTLPALPPSTWKNRHDAESWIGFGPKPPRVRDYHAKWPSMACE